MNLETNSPSSFSFFSHVAFTWSVASASRPRMIAFSKFFRKSFFDPKKLGFAKLSKEKYSERSFFERITSNLSSSDKIPADAYLDWGARKDYTTLHIERIQGLKCERLYGCTLAFSTEGRCEAVRCHSPEFFKRCPSSQSRRPILQFVKCAVSVLNVS